MPIALFPLHLAQRLCRLCACGKAPSFSVPLDGDRDDDPVVHITAVLDDHMDSLEDITGECARLTPARARACDVRGAMLWVRVRRWDHVPTRVGAIPVADKSLELEKKLKRLEGAFGI